MFKEDTNVAGGEGVGMWNSSPLCVFEFPASHLASLPSDPGKTLVFSLGRGGPQLSGSENTVSGALAVPLGWAVGLQLDLLGKVWGKGRF